MEGLPYASHVRKTTFHSNSSHQGLGKSMVAASQGKCLHPSWNTCGRERTRSSHRVGESVLLRYLLLQGRGQDPEPVNTAAGGRLQ